jgi:hypothetical protein
MHGTHRLVIAAAIVMAVQETRQLAPFKSIEVSGGAHVVLRPAAAHRVRVVRGSMDLSRVAVMPNGALVIEKCRTKCPKGYRLELEVFAPGIFAISVEHGGRIESGGGFARQAEMVVAVSNGGTINIRSISADRVTATVNQGGGIFTSPRTWLSASVANGGNITYWGDPQVKQSVDHAGAVQRGQ